MILLIAKDPQFHILANIFMWPLISMYQPITKGTGTDGAPSTFNFLYFIGSKSNTFYLFIEHFVYSVINKQYMP